MMREEEGRQFVARILEERREELGLNKREMAKYLDIPYGTYNNYSNPELDHTLQPDTIAHIGQKLHYQELEFFRKAYGLDADQELYWLEKEYFAHVYARLTREQQRFLIRIVRGAVGDDELVARQIRSALQMARDLPRLELSAWHGIGRVFQDIYILLALKDKEKEMFRLIKSSLGSAGVDVPSDEELLAITTHVGCQTLIDALSPFQAISTVEKLMYLTFYLDAETPPWDRREDVLVRWAALTDLVSS